MILEKWWPSRRRTHHFSKINKRGRADEAELEPLGRGLWRRTYDDCARAAAVVPELSAMLPAVRALAEHGQVRWPTDSLDVPADPQGRAAFEHLRAVRRALREVAYRSTLMAAGQDVASQQRRRDEAFAAAQRLLA